MVVLNASVSNWKKHVAEQQWRRFTVFRPDSWGYQWEFYEEDEGMAKRTNS